MTTDHTARQIGVKSLYIFPASPRENGQVVTLNGKRIAELLNLEIFDTLYKAKLLIERWR